MPRGFFTVEKWQSSECEGPARWVPVLQLDSNESLTSSLEALQQRGEPGLFRVVQTQRCIWAEMEEGKLRLHGSHVCSPDNLADLVKIYELEGGRRPIEKARQDRARAKAERAYK